LTVYEKLVTKSMGVYSVGDEVTLADLCLIPQMLNAARFKVSLENFPNIQKIVKNLEEVEAFKKAHPDVQPDFKA